MKLNVLTLATATTLLVLTFNAYGQEGYESQDSGGYESQNNNDMRGADLPHPNDDPNDPNPNENIDRSKTEAGLQQQSTPPQLPYIQPPQDNYNNR